MDEDEVMHWQDVLDEVMAGRRADLKCPFCKKGALTVEKTEHGHTRILCTSCRKFIEGKFPEEAL